MITLSFSGFFTPKPLYAVTTPHFSCTLNALYSCTPQYLYLGDCRKAAWMLASGHPHSTLCETGLLIVAASFVC